MKRFYILLVLLSNIAFAKLDGGISGGGGNVIASTKPSSVQDPRAVRHIIKETRHLLLKYLYAKYALYETGSLSEKENDWFDHFFNQGEEICELTKEIEIEIPINKGCFDQNGIEYDGSSFNPTEKSICISAYRIAKNTIYSEIPIQATALMLHEYGEFFGLTDEEAIELQKQAILELKNW